MRRLQLGSLGFVCSLTACALPSVTLGASFGLSRGHAQDGRAVVRGRSAAWIALGTSHSAPPEREPELEPAPQANHADEALPCALPLACDWEREQVARADQLWSTP